MIAYKLPPLKTSPKTPAVYKMIFDTGHFYFGSTVDMKKRMDSWKANIKLKDTQKDIIAVSKITNSIEFIILHIIPDLTERRNKESVYINENIGNPMCLNVFRKTLITGCKGFKKYIPDKDKKILPKPIARVDENNQILESFNSVSEAVKKYNLQSRSPVSLKNSRRTEYGMMFRYLDEQGNPIINTPVRSKITRASRKGVYLSTCVKMIQKDTSGNIVKVHLSIADAARSVGTKPKTFQKQIKESKTGYHKGYIWKIG